MHAPAIRSWISPVPLAGARVRWATFALLGVVGGLTRVPFARSTPINWDAVQFALALEHFDLHHHQPHPPGYLLYVLLGRAIDLLIADPALSLSLLSVLFSAISIPIFFALCCHIF